MEESVRKELASGIIPGLRRATDDLATIDRMIRDELWVGKMPHWKTVHGWAESVDDVQGRLFKLAERIKDGVF